MSSEPSGWLVAIDQMGAGDTPAAVRTLDEACTVGAVDACVVALTWFADHEQAPLWAKTACAARVVQGCAASEEADEILLACELGDGESCAVVAAAESGRKAARLWAQACHGGVLSACETAAASWYLQARFDRAAALWALGCEGGEPASCALQKEALKAQTLQMSCEKSDASCVDLCRSHGLMCSKAQELAERSCSRAHPEACTAVAAALIETGDKTPSVANKWLWRGCDNVDATACLWLADRVQAGRGELPSAARGDVSWLRNQGCDLQSDYACAHLP